MFVNVNKIYGKLKELGLTVADAAEKMDIDRSTLYRKLGNNGSGLTVRDAQLLIEILKLNNHRFFDQEEISRACELLEIDGDSVAQYFFTLKVQSA